MKCGRTEILTLRLPELTGQNCNPTQVVGGCCARLSLYIQRRDGDAVKKPLPHSQPDTFDQFGEAQPFLQLLADLLNRLTQERNEPETDPDEPVQESAG